jgi:hypothetical protein
MIGLKCSAIFSQTILRHGELNIRASTSSPVVRRNMKNIFFFMDAVIKASFSQPAREIAVQQTGRSGFETR